MEHWKLMPMVLINLIADYSTTYIAFEESTIEYWSLRRMLLDESRTRAWQYRIDYQKKYHMDMEPSNLQYRECFVLFPEK